MDNKEKLQNNINPLLAVFLIIQIIIILLIIFSMPKLFQDNNNIDSPTEGPSIKIEGISAIIPDDFPEWRDLIEWDLFKTSLNNSKKESIPDSSITASIREETIKTQYFEEQNINYVRAIIDIPELLQSYELFLEYPNIVDATGVIEFNEPDIAKPYSILCLKDSKTIIFSEFNCKDNSNFANRKEIAFKMLRYKNFNNFNLKLTDEDNNIIGINTVYNTQIERDQSLKEIKEFIDSLGISPNLFEYRFLAPDDYTFIMK